MFGLATGINVEIKKAHILNTKDALQRLQAGLKSLAKQTKIDENFLFRIH